MNIAVNEELKRCKHCHAEMMNGTERGYKYQCGTTMELTPMGYRWEQSKGCKDVVTVKNFNNPNWKVAEAFTAGIPFQFCITETTTFYHEDHEVKGKVIERSRDKDGNPVYTVEALNGVRFYQVPERKLKPVCANPVVPEVHVEIQNPEAEVKPEDLASVEELNEVLDSIFEDDEDEDETNYDDHYAQKAVQPIDVMEETIERLINAGVPPKKALNTVLAMKYQLRAGLKEGEDPDKDLRKAANYMHRAETGAWL